jgi:hypothetical protein
MMRHIVLFRRKPDVTKDDVLEKALAARMYALGQDIPAIKCWVFRANELQRAICWDYVLEAQVEDTQALNEYLAHPLHVALVTDLKPYFEWAAADYSV